MDLACIAANQKMPEKKSRSMFLREEEKEGLNTVLDLDKQMSPGNLVLTIAQAG
tara:strand:- start:29 stop:190 length:162 start_codon:yes stop_codon:yes gene_type:complete